MKTGICIAGPAWIVRSRIATPAAHIAAVKFTSSASTISANRSTPLPSTCMPVAIATTNSSTPTATARTIADERVAGEHAEPVRRGQEQPPREPVLEVRRDPEPGEHAAERRRLQQHEHELERRVARREVEARHVADARQAAREGDEEEQREDQRRQQQLRVGHDLLDRAVRRRPSPRPRSASCPRQPCPQGAHRADDPDRRRSPRRSRTRAPAPAPASRTGSATAGPRTGRRSGCRWR